MGKKTTWNGQTYDSIFGVEVVKAYLGASQGFSVVCTKKELDRFVTSFLEDGEICT